MPGTELTRTTGRLPAQRLGMLPTRQYWDGAPMAPARAAIAGVTAGIAGSSVHLLTGAPTVLSTVIWTGIATLIAVTLGLGLIERWARKRANR